MDRDTIWQWIRRHWIALLAILLLGLPAASFLLGSAGLLLYTFLPVDYSRIAFPDIRPTTRHYVLLAHGVGDTPASWTAPLSRLLQHSSKSASKNRTGGSQILALDWSQYAESTFRCAVNGKRIGEFLGKKLATNESLKSVHLIGHSCGSFVIYGLCLALKEQHGDIQVQTTYLDPVSIYGGLDWNYGLKHFGDCADFSDAYIDTEDGVPGSNELLPHTHTFDVTAVRKKTDYSPSPHVWPTAYYTLLVKAGRQPQLSLQSNLEQRYPKAVLEALDELPQ